MYLKTPGTEVLIHFEAWAKLAQQWFVCAPLGTHLEPINKKLCLVTGAYEKTTGKECATSTQLIKIAKARYLVGVTIFRCSTWPRPLHV